jgi:hypothetical protein
MMTFANITQVNATAVELDMGRSTRTQVRNRLCHGVARGPDGIKATLVALTDASTATRVSFADWNLAFPQNNEADVAPGRLGQLRTITVQTPASAGRVTVRILTP